MSHRPETALPLAGPAATGVIVLPRRVVRWAHENSATTLGALVGLAPDLDDLRAKDVTAPFCDRLSVCVREVLGLSWPELAARIGSASDEGRYLASIRLRAPGAECVPAALRLSVAERRAAARRTQALARVTARRREVEAGLVASFRLLVEELGERPRRVILALAGLDGPPQTARSLAHELGLTHQRIGQIEDASLERLREEVGWIEEVRRRVSAALCSGAVPLATLARDPWWAEAAAAPETLHYLGHAVLEDALHRIDVDGEQFVASFSASEVEATYEACCAAAERLPLPASIADVRALLAPAERFGARIVELLLVRSLRGFVVTGQEPDALVAARGHTAAARLLGVLRSAPAPLRLSSLPASLRQCVLPEEVIRFGPDLVGAARHFPDMDAWSARLVPAALRWMEGDGPERQCHAGELLEALREHVAIPAWLTEWHLGALLAQSGKARRLGRLRFAPPSAPAHTKRIFLRDRALRILQEHGEPMTRRAMLEALAQETSVTPTSLGSIFAAPPFLPCDRKRVGLLDRDLPGGEAARAQALDHAARLLAQRGQGLGREELAGDLRRLSAEHARWTPWMCLAVVRSDARFRASRKGGVELASWESGP